MIPKIIHFCWLSNDEYPSKIAYCINSWKDKLPDYEIRLWNLSRFDIDSSVWCKEAFESRKYAFAADYIRVYALYTEGGIYLDSDVKVLKRFDEYLKYSYFSSVENQLSKTNYKLLINRFIDKNGKRINDRKCYFLGIQAAIIGAEKNNKLIGEILNYYQHQTFIDNNGNIFHEVAPIVHAIYAEKYGFVYQDRLQFLSNNIVIFPSNIFATNNINNDNQTIALHCCNGGWVKKDKGLKRLLKKSKFIMDLHLKWIIISKKQEINLIK